MKSPLHLETLANFFLLPDVEQCVKAGVRCEEAFVFYGGNSNPLDGGPLDDEVKGMIAVLSQFGRNPENEIEALFELYETLILAGHPIPDGARRRCCVRVIAGVGEKYRSRAIDLMKVCIPQGILSWENSDWARARRDQKRQEKKPNPFEDPYFLAENSLFASAATYAVRAGNLDMLKLLNRNMPPTTKFGLSAWTNDENPMTAAAEGGHIEIMQYLLKMATAKEWAEIKTPHYIRTPFIWDAVIGGHIGAVKWMMTQGFDLNEESEQKDCGIIEQCLVYGKDPKMPLQLIELGASINPPRSDFSPLHVAILKDREDVFNVLMKAGADIHALDLNGQTPFFRAASMGKALFASALAHAGADIDAKNKQGETALHVACSRDNIEIFELLKSLGADMHIKDEKGQTPFDVSKGATRAAIERDMHDAMTPEVQPKSIKRARL